MKILWVFILLSLFMSSCSSQPNHDESQMYIIQVRNDLKPLAFADVEQWYRSILRSLTSNPLDSQRGRETDLHYIYKTIFHGFAAALTPQQSVMLKTRPEVLAVYPNRALQLHTTRSPQFLGLVSANNIPTPSGLLKDSDYGSDVVIGVLDTGIWPEAESFKDDGLDPIPVHWKGECVQGQNFTKENCNKKLVGARFFGRKSNNGALDYDSPRDADGHGTHTSSTAAGNQVANASLFGYAPGIATGIARKARIAVYKICRSFGCAIVDVVAGFDKAVEDGVDIISFSVGGPTFPYHLDPVSIAQFGAMRHNVFVSASAGNSGPSLSSVTNVAPWVMTVGAGTMDRRFPADLVLKDGVVFTGTSLYSGQALPEKTYFPLVYYGEASSSALCMPGSLDSKPVNGKIVVCAKGSLARVQKGEVVKKAGGVGMILTNVYNMGESLIADPHVLPTVAINTSATVQLLAYIENAKDPRGTILFRGTELNIHPAPLVAGFSSRGPNPISDSIIKPDLIAPGVHLLAAWPDNISPSTLSSDTRRTKFNILSGTSMSCPHISGVAALLKGVYPGWSPSRIKSALMTTSYVVDNNGDLLRDEITYNTSTIWGYGSGHVDPEKAIDPGLVYDASVMDYIGFLCASNYTETQITKITGDKVECQKGLNAWDLNYPSIAVTFKQTKSATYEAAVTRRATMVSEVASSYTVKIENPTNVLITVDPPKLDFKETEETLTYVVKISAKRFNLTVTDSKTEFGRIVWLDGKHTVGMPVAVTQLSAEV